MGNVLKLHRGKYTSAVSKHIVLESGEIFLEVPETGEGTGEGKIYMGDGSSTYENLPAFIDPSKKVDKVASATAGNIAGLDASGNLADSGVASDDLLVKSDTSGLVKNDGTIDTNDYDFSIVALYEESPATVPHEKGSYLTYNRIVYEVIDDIDVGDELVVDTNIKVPALNEGTVVYYEDSDDAASIGSLDELDDVAIITPTTGQVLGYDGTTHQWSNISIPSPTGKADKVANATDGDFATLDSSGNLVDSGKKATTSVTQNSTDLVTSGAVYSYIDTMITQALTGSY